MKIMKTIVLYIFQCMYHNYGGSETLFINYQACSKLTKNKIFFRFRVGNIPVEALMQPVNIKKCNILETLFLC